MVTKSMARTPFGMKLIYKINDECIWSEYLANSPSQNEELPHTIPFRQRRICADESQTGLAAGIPAESFLSLS